MKGITGTAAVLLLVSVLEAGEVGPMNTFVANTPALADEVNANFGEHTTQINDNNSRISANTAAIAAIGLVGWSTLAVPRTTSPLTGTFVGEFVKIGDMGSYVKQQDASVLEIQYSGRICVGVIADDQVVFELRVDDTPSSAGPARSMLQYGEEGCLPSHPATITGIFDGLSAGSHTVSMWVRAESSGMAVGSTNALYNPADSSADHLVIKEFGTP
ncbi:hypothetical protein WCX72_09620 [Sulfurimonas sp. HSL1-6]|uniref:hypothetical protein n=1 Tax=Thiomicrolovo immobilis TaxID=3131935 RepID=UPI0031F8A460